MPKTHVVENQRWFSESKSRTQFPNVCHVTTTLVSTPVKPCFLPRSILEKHVVEINSYDLFSLVTFIKNTIVNFVIRACIYGILVTESL